MNTTAARRPRACVSAVLGGLCALTTLPSLAHAQSAVAAGATVRPDVREEILGYDAARSVLVYVERTQSVAATFAHVALVEVSANGTPRRTQLTTPADLEACRPTAVTAGAVAPGGPSPLAGGAAAAARAAALGGPPGPGCSAVETRVRDQINAARGRVQPGVALPVSELNAAPGAGCTRTLAVVREFTIGSNPPHSARIEMLPSGGATSLTFASGSRRGAALSLPAAAVTAGSTIARVPYNRLADVRQIPGIPQLAVMLRSDACTPENASVPALAMLVPAPPPAEDPMVPLGHAELSEAEVMHAVAPRARRSEGSWADNNGRVTFDNAWTLPDGHVLVQYTNHSPSGPPQLQFASFALFENNGNRLRYLTHAVPRGDEPVFTGMGQEAFAADLDHDGRAEIFLRTMTSTVTESGALIAYDESHIHVLWRGRLRGGDQNNPTSPTAGGRRCVPGLERDALVLRCTAETPGATNVPPIVRRLRFNGGALSISDER